MSIWEAAKQGNVEDIKHFLDHKKVSPDAIEAKHPNKYAPLHQTALAGHVNATTFLLQKGADPNIKTRNGCTPLHTAAQNDHLPVVEVLIDWDADVNSTSKDKSTPLMASARRGHTDVVKYLLDNGATLNATNQDKRTALHWSAHGGHAKIVRCLLERNARVNACDKDGDTPMDDAAKEHHWEVMQVISSSPGFHASKCKNSSKIENLLMRELHKHVKPSLPHRPPSPVAAAPQTCLISEDIYDLSHSNGVIQHWKHIMRGLGLAETDITLISANNQHDIRECICQGLHAWQNVKARKATREKLCEILRKEGLEADAEALEESR